MHRRSKQELGLSLMLKEIRQTPRERKKMGMLGVVQEINARLCDVNFIF